MKYLLIDTSSANVIVSIIENNNILYCYNRYVESDLSSKILTIIDEGLRTRDTNLKSIDKIFVVNGPGSFTGIRVGVTVSKNIAWALDIDVIPISSLELFATTQTDKKYIVPMIDARRRNVFGAIYDTNLNIVKEEALYNLDKLLKDTNDQYELVSYDDLKLNSLIKPQVDIIKIIKKHEKDESINPHKLNPRYLKLTEAEENLKNSD